MPYVFMVKKRQRARLVQNKGALLFVIILVILLAILLVCLMKIQKSENNQENSSQLANPASVYCIEHGGKLEIRTDASGGQYGICIKDGKECDEWAYFRNECEL